MTPTPQLFSNFEDKTSHRTQVMEKCISVGRKFLSHKTLLMLVMSASIYGCVNLAYAAARNTPFTPGQTIDPGTDSQPCGPLDANCFPSATSSISNITGSGQGWIYSNGTGSVLSASTSPTVGYITATSTTATSTFAGGLTAGGAAGLTVSQNGNVGIGTNAPAFKLDVAGTIGSNGYRALYIPNQSVLGTSTDTGITGFQNGSYNGNLFIGNGGMLSTSTNTILNPIDPLSFEVNGSYNGLYDTFVGMGAGLVNAAGNYNTFVGTQAGVVNANGDQNTFIGSMAGWSNTSGYHNTFIGAGAGQSWASGNYNNVVATDGALHASGGSYNNMFGNSAGSYTTGNYNSFFGNGSGPGNTSGVGNAAFGATSLGSNTTGNYSTAVGLQSLQNSVLGSENTGIGVSSGKTLTGGSNNSFLGSESDVTSAASTTLTNGTAIGYKAIVGASNSLILGGTGANAVNVGIGTTSPFAKLSIMGTANGTTPLFAIATTTGSATTTVFQIDQNGVVTENHPSATSTINGNLYVNGTLRSTTSYNGDLIFANGFRFTEAPSDTVPQSLYLNNQYGQNVLNVDEHGNLNLLGDVCSGSSSCFGKSLSDLSADVSALANTTAEEQALTFSGLNLRINDLASTTGSTTLDLQNRVSSLEAFSSTTASSTAGVLGSSPTFIQTVASAVLDLMKSIGNMAVDTVTAVSGVFTRVQTDSVETNSVQTNTLCVDNVCLNKTQLKALLIQAGATASSTPDVISTTQPVANTPITAPAVNLVIATSTSTSTSTSTIPVAATTTLALDSVASSTPTEPISTSTPTLNLTATSTDAQTASTTVPIVPVTPSEAVSSSTPAATSSQTSTSTPTIIPPPDASASTTPNL